MSSLPWAIAAFPAPSWMASPVELSDVSGLGHLWLYPHGRPQVRAQLSQPTHRTMNANDRLLFQATAFWGDLLDRNSLLEQALIKMPNEKCPGWVQQLWRLWDRWECSLSEGLYKMQHSFKCINCGFSKSVCFTLSSHESKHVCVYFMYSHKLNTHTQNVLSPNQRLWCQEMNTEEIIPAANFLCARPCA